MQDTRLSSLTSRLLAQFRVWLINPWRRLSLIVIGLLFGNFFATVVATTTGQQASLDAPVSAILLGVCELVSWIAYRGGRSRAEQSPLPQRRPFSIDLLNSVKIGLIYGLFVEAFKLGS